MKKGSTHRTKDKSENIIKYYLDFLKRESLIQNIWIMSLFLGGIISWRYYLEIKFLPEIDAQSLLVLGFGSFIAGFLLIFSISYLVVFPGTSWNNFIKQEKILNNYFSEKKYLILDSRPRKIELNKRNKNNQKKIFYYFWLLFLNISFVFSLSYIFTFKNKTWGFVFLFIDILVLFCIFVNVHRIISSTENKEIRTFSIVLQMIYSSFFSSWAYVISCLILYSFVKSDIIQNKAVIFIGFLLPIIFCFLASLLVIYLDIKSLSFNIIIGFALVLVLMIILQKVNYIPGQVMKIYGWGNISNASIVVNQAGCQVVKQMGIKVEDKCANKDEVYRIDGLCILSSIGKNYYLRFPDYYPQGQIEAATFTVPSSNVVSWSRQNIGMDLPTNYKKDKFYNI
jgi:hypothetical protein